MWCSLLADPSLQATVFVPGDRAWASLLRVLGWTRDRLLNDQSSRDALRTVLQVGGGSTRQWPPSQQPAVAALPWLQLLLPLPRHRVAE